MGFFKNAIKNADKKPAFDYDYNAFFHCPAVKDRTGGWQLTIEHCIHYKTSQKSFIRNAHEHCLSCTICWDLAKRATLRDRAEKEKEEKR